MTVGLQSVRSVLGLVAVVSAAATMWPGPAAASVTAHPSSTPVSVSSACSWGPYRGACAIALRYLAALDLDHAREACRLLDAPTLEGAGGLSGCTRILLRSKGTRIHYSISGARCSPRGTMVSFSTWAGSNAPVRQQMLISRVGLIVWVFPEL